MIFVPATVGGQQKRRLQEMDKGIKFKIKCKYIEARCVTMKSKLFKVEP